MKIISQFMNICYVYCPIIVLNLYILGKRLQFTWKNAQG